MRSNLLFDALLLSLLFSLLSLRDHLLTTSEYSLKIDSLTSFCKDS